MKILLTTTKTDKLSLNQQLIFLDYLRQTLANGFSLNAALKLLPQIWPAKQEILSNINQKVESGKKFSQILLEIGFSKTTATQIDMALMQGSLIDCLDQLAQLNRLKIKQLKKIKGELAYPAVLVVMMLTLLFFMHTFLKNEMMISDGGSDVLFGVLAIAVISGIIGISRIFYLLNKQDYHALKKLSMLPIIGQSIKLYVHYLIVYDLALLLQNGFSFQQICALLQSQPLGSVQQALGEKIYDCLKLGKSLSEVIENEIFLPKSLLLLITTGATREEIGKRCVVLGKTLFYELNLKINKMVVNIQPICFVFIGMCILGMYLKILLPMYATMQNM
ncbi:type II secretion system F family protein [Lactobacillus sp.]|uniref:type II secretion system F family protein n=1 Tax=Lactobacillus sp. TaxID=1591 RepID=UPI00199DF864|nr:type II secretion system F family protein [Lactobacillus sp.]MBD5430407.1 type II secretion system protein F [Lactobacillus sp.]